MSEPLASQVMTIGWEHLRPHAGRDALWIVEDADLVAVAEAFARDDVAAVQAWLASDRLRRPDPPMMERWDAQGTLFRALVVQPWVVAQVVPAAEA